MYTQRVLVYCSKRYSIRITYEKKIVSRKKKKRENVKKLLSESRKENKEKHIASSFLIIYNSTGVFPL